MRAEEGPVKLAEELVRPLKEAAKGAETYGSCFAEMEKDGILGTTDLSADIGAVGGGLAGMLGGMHFGGYGGYRAAKALTDPRHGKHEHGKHEHEGRGHKKAAQSAFASFLDELEKKAAEPKKEEKPPAKKPPDPASGSTIGRAIKGTLGAVGSVAKGYGNVASGTAGALNPTGFMRHVFSSLPGQGISKEKAYDVVADPLHERRMQAIQNQAVLHDMLANDEVVSGYHPDDVLKAYNEISQAAPRAASQPAMLRALLRHQLAQGQLDTHDVDQAVGVEGKLRANAEPAAAPKNPFKEKKEEEVKDGAK
jgi:hypothetical protein